MSDILEKVDLSIFQNKINFMDIASKIYSHIQKSLEIDSYSETLLCGLFKYLKVIIDKISILSEEYG